MTDLERKYNRTVSDVEYAAVTLWDVKKALGFWEDLIGGNVNYAESDGSGHAIRNLNAFMTMHHALTDKLEQVYDELMATVNANCDTLAGRDQEGDGNVDQD